MTKTSAWISLAVLWKNLMVFYRMCRKCRRVPCAGFYVRTHKHGNSTKLSSKPFCHSQCNFILWKWNTGPGCKTESWIQISILAVHEARKQISFLPSQWNLVFRTSEMLGLKDGFNFSLFQSLTFFCWWWWWLFHGRVWITECTWEIKEWIRSLPRTSCRRFTKYFMNHGQFCCFTGPD